MHVLFVTGAGQAPGYGGIIPNHWKKKRSEILGEESSATDHDPQTCKCDIQVIGLPLIIIVHMRTSSH